MNAPDRLPSVRHLFIDMNAYFASVEQSDKPEYRGKPIAVVPVKAESTCCIAASYEAKRRGVRTGTPVWQARALCPEIELALARPSRYVEIHKQLVKAVGRCLPVDKIMSIDEMACGLMGEEREPPRAEALARGIKAEVKRALGPWLTCSIGIGPNVLLAKVAADMKKPDGLTVIRREDLPARLHPLKLTDFPGIGPRMEKRFHRYGVTTAEELCSLGLSALARVWGSRVHARRWYDRLRGEDVPDAPTRRRTLGHSHVLAPKYRTGDGPRAVMVRLIHKAAARLRDEGFWAGAVAVGVRYADGGRWHDAVKVPKCQDTLNFLLAFAKLWEKREDQGPVLQVWMVLSDLVPADAATPSLFDEDRRMTAASHVMDRINRAFGKNAVHFGTLFGGEDSAPTRISFTTIPEFNPAFT